MPLYDYQCRACSTVTEVRHGFREVYDGTCPACGGALARVFNPAGIVFKGSGFYVTDSRKSSGSSDSSSTSSDSSSSSSSASSSSSGSSSGSSGSSSSGSSAA
ncbi:MAG: FmdB family transcriptional regulator [Candidatus Eremiobacteraeota bacterium]|nr:FmdB family transcriptional regulator [Candidatus Eremiobacteraeota bacterium]